MTLLELADAVERASGAETEAMLRLAFDGIYGAKPPRVHGGSKELDAYLRIFNPFYKLLIAGAYLDAAIKLAPEGRHTEMATQDRHSMRWKWTLRGGYGIRSEARANTAALALTAACLRARAAIENTHGDAQ